MEEIKIYKFQLENIKEALRITRRLLKTRNKLTSYDRDVEAAVKYVDNALEGNIDERVTR